MNCNDTALQMAWTRTPFLHHKPDGAVLDPHGSTCCSSGCSPLCPCMFSSSSPSGVSLSVSVPSVWSPALSPTPINSSALPIPWYVSLTFLFTGAKQAAMSLPHFMITNRRRNTTQRHPSHFISNHPSRFNMCRYHSLLSSVNLLFIVMQQPRLIKLRG